MTSNYAKFELHIYNITAQNTNQQSEKIRVTRLFGLIDVELTEVDCTSYISFISNEEDGTYIVLGLAI